MSIVLLAKNLGLSISTVSRALNGYDDVSAATRERVVLRAKAIGYRPNPSARRLGAGKTSAIGVILPAASSTGQAVDSMYSSLLCGVVTEIEPAGYHLLASMQAKHDAAREAAVEQAKRVANRAFKAGMPQAEIARIMGVDKSRTVRRWLGLMAD